MATVIDALIVTLGLDPKDFTKGQKDAATAFTKTREAATKTGKDIEASSQKAADSIDRIARNALRLFAVFTAGKAIKDFVSDITSADSALGRLSQRIGQAPGDISAVATAVQRTGGSFDAAAGSFQRFSDSIQELKATGNTGILPFLYRVQAAGGKQINLNKDILQTQVDIADNLKAINDKQGAATANYYGKQLGFDEGTVALMVQGGKAYRDYIEQSKRLGIATKEDTDAAQAFQRSIRTLMQASESLGRSIMTAVTPVIVDLLKPLQEWIEKNREWIKTEITARVREFAEYLKTIDWKSIGQGIRDFVVGCNNAAQAVGGWSNVIKALFALWLGSKFFAVLRAIGLLRLALTGGTLSGGLISALGVLATPGGLAAILAGVGIGAGAAAANQMPKVLEREGAAGVDPGTGGATERSPMDRSGHEGSGRPWLRRQWNRAKRFFGGGDAEAAEGGAGIRRRGRRGANYSLDGTPGSKEPIGGKTFREKAPGVMKRLMSDFGLSKEEAAVVLGNLGHESAGFKAFEEGGGGPGRGWAQWTDPGRKRRFFEYAQKHKLDPKSDEANYGFLKWELENTHKAAIDALKTAPNRGEKMRQFERIFEGAGVKAYGSRNRYADAAERAYDEQEKSKAGTPSVPTAPVAPPAASANGAPAILKPNSMPDSPGQTMDEANKARAAKTEGTLAERAGAGFEYGPQTGYPNSRSLKQMNDWLWDKKGKQPTGWKQDKDTGNWKPEFNDPKPSAWNGIPAAAAAVAQVQAAQAAQMARVSNDNRSTTSNQTKIGDVTIHTAATDANGIARGMEQGLKNRSFAMAANYGQA